MIIWIVLFSIIIAASLFLALRSMRDYSAMPVHSDTVYSLYLIKNEKGLTEDILKEIDTIINQKRLIISFERLFKGSKKALVVYGPAVILKQFTEKLNLVELEDYSLKYDPSEGSLAWEISSRDFRKTGKPLQFKEKDSPILGLEKTDLNLGESEELWWQLVIQPKCERESLQVLFKALIRVVVIAQNDNKARSIKEKIDDLVKNTNLVTLPQVYSTEQTVKSYQKRSLPQRPLGKEEGHFILVAEDVRDLLN